MIFDELFVSLLRLSWWETKQALPFFHVLDSLLEWLIFEIIYRSLLAKLFVALFEKDVIFIDFNVWNFWLKAEEIIKRLQ